MKRELLVMTGEEVKACGINLNEERVFLPAGEFSSSELKFRAGLLIGKNKDKRAHETALEFGKKNKANIVVIESFSYDETSNKFSIVIKGYKFKKEGVWPNMQV